MKASLFAFALVSMGLIASAAGAESLLYCTDASHCSAIAEGADARTAMMALRVNPSSLNPGPLDCSASCKAECRIEFNDCIRSGELSSSCAALRAVCEQDCKK